MNRDLLDALSRAEKEGHVALTRHLCEQVLTDEPSHGSTLIRYADCLIDLSLYENAAVVLDQADRVIPRELQQLVLAQRGHLCKSMGDHAEAERFFISAHEHDPDDATYLIYAGSAAFARGDISRAESLARKAVECSDGCIDEAYFNLGGYLLAQKKYDEARSCYVRALEIDPEYQIAKARLEDLDHLLKFQ
jgi:tetratricopeptide (TPR) repeat protein